MVWALNVDYSIFIRFSYDDTSAGRLYVAEFFNVYSSSGITINPGRILLRREMERLEEEQACRSLLILFSNAFSASLPEFRVLSLDDVEKSGLFQSERESMVKQKHCD